MKLVEKTITTHILPDIKKKTGSGIWYYFQNHFCFFKKSSDQVKASGLMLSFNIF